MQGISGPANDISAISPVIAVTAAVIVRRGTNRRAMSDGFPVLMSPISTERVQRARARGSSKSARAAVRAAVRTA